MFRKCFMLYVWQKCFGGPKTLKMFGLTLWRREKTQLSDFCLLLSGQNSCARFEFQNGDLRRRQLRGENFETKV